MGTWVKAKKAEVSSAFLLLSASNVIYLALNDNITAVCFWFFGNLKRIPVFLILEKD